MRARRIFCFLALFYLPCWLVAQGIITTVGGTSWVFRSEGGAAVNAPLGETRGVAVDSAGNIYASDFGNHIVVKITPNGILSVVAGNGIRGRNADNGPAISSSLSFPSGVALDSAGNLYIADTDNRLIRKVTPTGIMTIAAGNGQGGFSGDNGPATSASLELCFYSGIAVDAANNIYIGDCGNNRIRRVGPNGTITTVAGNGTKGFSGDGGPATSASLDSPGGVVVDSAGNVYFADVRNNRVRRVDPTGKITTIVGSADGTGGDGGPATSVRVAEPIGVWADLSGNLYIAETIGSRIRKVDTRGIITTVAGTGQQAFSGDGGPATSASLFLPTGVTADGAGNLYVADSLSRRVRKVGADGIITTVAGNGLFKIAGDGGPATSASLNSPTAVALDATGNLYVADTRNNRIRKITPTGIITTVAGNGTYGVSGEGGLATTASLALAIGSAYVGPGGVATDAAGNVYFSEANAARIRRVDAAGTITTVAGSSGSGFSGDGGPATSAQLGYQPGGLTVGTNGDLYIADFGNHRIRRVAPNGIITTVAGNGQEGFSGDGGPATSASLNYPSDVALDQAGNLYIADRSNKRIRRVSPSGTITTFAGNGLGGFAGDNGPAINAPLEFPTNVAVDIAGNLYISNRSRIRRVSPSGMIVTVAGGGCCGPSGDGGLATDASLSDPTGLTIDAVGNLYIADNGPIVGNDRIRKVLIVPPSFSVLPTTLTVSAPSRSETPITRRISVTGEVVGLGVDWAGIGALAEYFPIVGRGAERHHSQCG